MDALSGSAMSPKRLRTRVPEAWLGLLALASLLLGTFIYVAERPAKVYFLPVACDPVEWLALSPVSHVTDAKRKAWLDLVGATCSA